MKNPASAFTVALAGYGRVAEQTHLRAWASVPGAQLVAVVDGEPARRAKAIRDQPGIRPYPNMAEMLAVERVDVLDVATPPRSHLSIIRAGALAGIGNVVCEKPLVTSMRELHELTGIRQAEALRLFTVNNWQHSDVVRTALAVIDSGRLGTVRGIDVRLERTEPAAGCEEWRPGWRLNPAESGGGILMDHGWHQIGLVGLLLGGKPTLTNAVLGDWSGKARAVERTAMVELELGEIRANVGLSWVGRRRSFDARIVGVKGAMQITDAAVVVDEEVTIVDPNHELSRSAHDSEPFKRLFAAASEPGEDNYEDAKWIMSTISEIYTRSGAWWLAPADVDT